jgi:antitoxin YefM
MITGIKHQSVVGKDGKIEIAASELAEGTKIEIIVLVEDAEKPESPDQPSDATAYLRSTSANRTKLLQALENAKDPNNLVVISAEEWNEKYHI